MSRASRVLALLLLAACATPDSRIKKHAAQFAGYPPEVQARIKAGGVDPGFDADMTRMALGEPSRKTTRKTADAVQEIWSYGAARARPSLGIGLGTGIGAGGFGGVSVGSEGPEGERARVVFEGGKVVSYEALKK